MSIDNPVELIIEFVGVPAALHVVRKIPSSFDLSICAEPPAMPDCVINILPAGKAPISSPKNTPGES